jgi:VWFA-related protein
MTRALAAACGLVLVAMSASGRAQDPKRDPQDQSQRQPFRTGAHYVRVDAYPTRDGKPILGLAAEDFELLEDGKLQAIDRLEFIEHPPWTPLGERRDPNSQREGLELARDPKYRVFVLYLDAFHVDFGGSHRARLPITELLSRMMGPQDLFGVLTPAQSPKDLLLGQMTLTIQQQLDDHPMWGIAGRIEPQPGEIELETFFRDGKYLVALKRLDKVYSDLEGLVALLGNLRDERKNIIFFSDTLPSPPTRFSSIASDPGGRGNPPGIGVGPGGTLTMGSRGAGDPDRQGLNAERTRLLSIDFDRRFRDILQRSREANVAFYTVRPGGLDVSSSLLNQGTSNLMVLAEQTDGIAVVNSNDLRAGLGKVADDLSSHYVLGYYTNNTRWDGGTRKLTVRLKGSRQAIRARREYRAPTEAEMAAIRDLGANSASATSSPSATDTALSALSRLRPAARLRAYGVALDTDVAVVAEIAANEIEEGRWKQGARVEVTVASADGVKSTAEGKIEPGSRGTLIRVPVGTHAGPWQALVKVRGDEATPESDSVSIERDRATLLGRPIAYRAASAAASAFRPLAAFYFRRTERLRLDWPVLKSLESQSARLLDRTGKALPVPIPLTSRESEGKPVLSGLLNLAPLSTGDYVIEVNAKAGESSEQQLIAIHVAMTK